MTFLNFFSPHNGGLGSEKLVGARQQTQRNETKDSTSLFPQHDKDIRAIRTILIVHVIILLILILIVRTTLNYLVITIPIRVILVLVLHPPTHTERRARRKIVAPQVSLL